MYLSQTSCFFLCSIYYFIDYFIGLIISLSTTLSILFIIKQKKKRLAPLCVHLLQELQNLHRKNLKVFAGNIQLNDSRIKESMLVSIVVSVASIHCYRLSAS